MLAGSVGIRGRSVAREVLLIFALLGAVHQVAFAAPRGQIVSVPVSFDLLATKTITIAEISDFDAGSPSTGYTRPDSFPYGTVDYGPLVPGTHIIGATPGYYALRFELQANDPWAARIRGTGDLTSGSDTIPLSRLRYAVDDGAAFTAFTTSFATFKTGGPTPGSSVTLDYLLRLMVSDRPGSYAGTIEIEVQ